MSECIEAFKSQITESPEIVDRFFKNGKFDVAALLEGAEELGYEFEGDDLIQIDDEMHRTALTGDISYLLPNSETGGITELTAKEVQLVAAGHQSQDLTPDYANININVNIFVVAAVVAVVIAAVLVFVI